VLNSLEEAHRRFPDVTHFAVTNDNTVAVVAYERGFNSCSWGINECLRRKEEMMPASKYTVTMRHVPGVNNVADAGSRGKIVKDEEKGELRALLRSRWGSIVGGKPRSSHTNSAATS